MADVFVMLMHTDLKRSDLEQAVWRVARRRLHRAAVQAPRHLSLFGRRGASGLRHEIDTGILASSWVGLTEVKSSSTVSKSDLIVFDGKTMDFYVDRIRHRRLGPHYRFFISTTPLKPSIAAFAMQRAIIVVEPQLVPLPFLLRLARSGNTMVDVGPSDETLLRQSSRPMEELWRPLGRDLLLVLDGFDAAEALAARRVHAMWSDLVVDVLGVIEPDWGIRRWRSIEAQLNSTVKEAARYE